MNYPNWAPKNLIAIHLLNHLENTSPRLDTEQKIAQIRKECKEVSDQQIEEIRTDLSRWSLFFPQEESGLPFSLSKKESTEILGKLITDQRMKAVWASIARRIEIELEFVHFWTTCGTIIQGWRRAQKLSTKQHREYFQKIHEHALALKKLMSETVEFQHSSITDLIEIDSIKWLLKALNTSLPKFEDEEESIRCARATLAFITPSVDVVLDDIALGQLEHQLMRLEPRFFEKTQEAVPLKRRVVDGRGEHVDEELGVARESFGISKSFAPAESIKLERKLPFLGHREEVERAGKRRIRRSAAQCFEAHGLALSHVDDRLEHGTELLVHEKLL